LQSPEFKPHPSKNKKKKKSEALGEELAGLEMSAVLAGPQHPSKQIGRNSCPVHVTMLALGRK
jgi:hypothetical protein